MSGDITVDPALFDPVLSSPIWNVRLFLLLVALCFSGFMITQGINDIDYDILVGGGANVLEGESPYAMPTYRYAGLVAVFYAPGAVLNNYGKYLNVLANCYMTLRCETLLFENYNLPAYLNMWIPMVFLCLNPFCIAMACRGSFDCWIALLLIEITIRLRRASRSDLLGNLVGGGVLTGLSVYLRLMPVVLVPSFISFLNTSAGDKLGVDSSPLGLYLRAAARSWLRRKTIVYLTVSAVTLAAFMGLQIALWGEIGMYEYLWYHLERKDHRQNLSLYFLGQYISYVDPLYSYAGTLMTVLRQMQPLRCLVCQVVFDFMAKLDGRPYLSVGAIAYLVLICQNPVLTMQYYMWPLAFIPCVVVEVAVLEHRILPLLPEQTNQDQEPSGEEENSLSLIACIGHNIEEMVVTLIMLVVIQILCLTFTAGTIEHAGLWNLFENRGSLLYWLSLAPSVLFHSSQILFIVYWSRKLSGKRPWQSLTQGVLHPVSGLKQKFSATYESLEGI